MDLERRQEPGLVIGWLLRYDSLGLTQHRYMQVQAFAQIDTADVRFGYRGVHVQLDREGWAVNHKRVHRLSREMGLQLRNKSPKRRVMPLTGPLQASEMIHSPPRSPRSTTWREATPPERLVMASTRRTGTPASYISISASEFSRRR
jgi:transposase InsO family protein